ncbi:S49 family peptidase [Mesorhizobium sp. KR1-2]|uniref:S49 family peptidase n=1 Tax=Mesorhizobium sp. KR1-2 TaxID=3156609 RepID=UPI0032B40B2E
MTDDLLFARVAAQFFGAPLLLRQPEADVIGAYIRSRMLGAGPDANRFQGQEQGDPSTRRWKGYRKEGNVGVVSILGELVNRGAWLGASSGLTSYEGIAQQMRNAAADPDVRSIILDIQSPGGQALGMNETARLIRQVNADKKVVAVVNAMAASAAYGLSSGASEIVITESGVAGSIGVLLVHADKSVALERAGITTTVIKAGDEKAIGNPYQALSNEDRSVLQAEVDRVMDGFVRLVSNHRPKLSAKAIRDLQAGIRIGEDAVKAGLADRLGSFEDVLADLGRGLPGPISRPRREVSSAQAHGDRLRAVSDHPRLAGLRGLRDFALARAEREPLAKSADDIVREVFAAFDPKLTSPSNDRMPAMTNNDTQTTESKSGRLTAMAKKLNGAADAKTSTETEKVGSGGGRLTELARKAFAEK